MGFDDLEAAERDRQDEGGESTQAESGDAEQSSAPEQPNGAASSTEASAERESGDRTSEQSSASVSDTPAFEYDEVKQSPLYARPEAWNALEDALDLEVVRALREAGLRNEEKRELHDAALRVAAEHPAEIAEAVEAARRDEE